MAVSSQIQTSYESSTSALGSISAIPRHSAPRRPRARRALTVLAVLAFLSVKVLASEGYLPPEITLPATLDVPTDVLYVDEPEWQENSDRLTPESFWDDDELLLWVRDEHDDDKESKTASKSDDKASKTASGGHGDGHKTSSTRAAHTSKTMSHKPTETASKVTGSKSTMTIPVAPTSSGTPTSKALPLPFDDTPSSDFAVAGGSSSCPDFMKGLLSSDTFKSCYPLSMMIQTSNSLFDAEKQLLSIVRVLDATCAADSSFCGDYFDQAAHNLTESSNCGEEFKSSQYLVMQAYNGMRAYRMIYAASCLQDPHQDMYCFASAVTNVTNPSDTSFYFLPYGYDLPGGTSPTCDWCTTQTMAILHAASADRSQPVSSVYVDAARQVNTLCGPGFVNDTLPKAEEGVASLFSPAYTFIIAGIGATVLLNAIL